MTVIEPPAMVVLLRICEKPPYWEPIEPTSTAPDPSTSSPKTTRFQPGWIAKMSASRMLRTSTAGPGGEATKRSRVTVRGLIVSVAASVPSAG